MLIGALFAWREARLADAETYGKRGAPLLGLAAGAAFLVFGWGFMQ